MSSATHQILAKKTQRNLWGFADHWRLVQETDAQIYWSHCWFHFK